MQTKPLSRCEAAGAVSTGPSIALVRYIGFNLHRLARIDVMPIDICLCRPGQEGVAGQFRAVVADGRLGLLRLASRASSSLRICSKSEEMIRFCCVWVATTAGISGEMIREHDGPLPQVALRRDPSPTPGVMALRQRIDFRRSQNNRGRVGAQSRTLLYPRRKPRKQRHGRGFRERTLKRDYVRFSPIPHAALILIDSRMEDYNTVRPHSRLDYRSPREDILFQPAAAPV